MTRINILMLVVSLLWTGNTWADEDSIMGYTVGIAVMVDEKAIKALIDEARRDGAVLNVDLYEYDDKREVWDRVRTSPCLDTMEAAMRAMEPFISQHWVDFDLPMNGGVRTEMLGSDLPAFRGAVAQWKKAKACWRKP